MRYGTPMTPEMRKILTEAERAAGHRSALAAALGVKPGSVTRWFKDGRPEWQYCLGLAGVTGRSAADVLRAAGRADEVAIIEAHFGASAAATERATSHTATLVGRAFDRLSPEHQEAVLAQLRAGGQAIDRPFVGPDRRKRTA